MRVMPRSPGACQEEEHKRALREQMQQLKQELLSAEKAKTELDEQNVVHEHACIHAHAYPERLRHLRACRKNCSKQNGRSERKR